MRSARLVLTKKINLRHLLGHKLRTALTVAGVAAGVALVFSISVINTTLLESARGSVRELAGAAEIEVAAADPTGLPAEVVDEVASVPGVERAVPLVRVTTKVTGPRGSERALVLGATADFTSLFPEGAADDISIEGGFGSLGGGLVLSQPVAEAVGIRTGDEALVGTPAGARRLEVTGIISGGPLALLNGGDLGAMFLPAAQATFAKEGRVDSIYVVVDAEHSVASVDRELESKLEAAVVGPPGERGRGFEQTFAALSTLTSLAGFVALFVALFVVYNTMSMALVERRREISMAQALGARRRDLVSAFLAEAAVIGAFSSAAGIGLGLVMARVLVARAVARYTILPLTGSGPIVVRPAHLLLAAAGGLLVCLGGAYVPARKVLSVSPVEALRPEASYEWTGSRGPRAGRVRLLAGTLSVAASLGLLVIFATMPDREWLAAAGLLAGLAGITLLLPAIVPVAVRFVRPLVRRGFGPVGRLASDALEKNPGRTTFTVGALVLTLAMVVSVGAALGSYESEIKRQARFWFGAPIYVTSDSFNGLGSDQPLPAAFEEEIEAVEGVRSAYAQRYGSVDVRGEQALLYALPVDEARRAGATDRLSGVTGGDETALVEGLRAGGVVVSRFTADHYGLEPGGSIELPTPSGLHRFPVAGIFPDLASFDSMYIDLAVYRRLWRDDKADRFAVLLEEGADAGAVAAALKEMVTAEGAPAEVLSKDQLIGSILDAIRGLFSIARAIQLAALVIAGLTIANTMFTAVFERRWESALSRAVGMTSRELRRVVALEAGVLGLVGSAGAVLLGSVLGLLMTRIMEVQFSWSVTFREPWALVGLALAGGIAISIVAGALPSRLAARTPIVESLRYE